MRVGGPVTCQNKNWHRKTNPCKSHIILKWHIERIFTASSNISCSTLDDPMLLSAMLPWTFFLTEHSHGKVRWSLCAREVCYQNALLAQFFQSGKVLPIARGQGPEQPIMHVAAREVAKGGWLHLFPEGKINYTGYLGTLRWGIGKLFCDSVVTSGRFVWIVSRSYFFLFVVCCLFFILILNAKTLIYPPHFTSY